MPKLTWMNKRPPKDVNHLAALLREYKRARKMTSEEMGEALGCTAECVRQQIRKPAGRWKVAELKRYCDLLEIPYLEAFEAATKEPLPVCETGKRQGK